eukprot:Gregarina_sp_Pseudo_9__1281@NODE_1852_length_1293_cov_543_294258_g1718_i0_p1_GENE_NODE_1852_length_1293_cov_543_294258_g1718_i0NODE_1852_length_1293_cov_543_294258_g1718_i0_p1_ORF_typecomplete_len301_score16_21GST_N_3/PF13417_6/3_9e13GST_N_3/PF13417_6/6_3e11GST_N_2/PF13409_6/4_3e05GST_N_2/PF13409_6/0_0023GST_N/PF02798_20/0_19GST_N/PF02798_20/1_4e05GST_N_4/PF17172_4/24GST_N_4/PF17172_4/2_1Glutaredoxin/PF00462_24/0_036Glutaredoxin/PF00462_24/9_1e02DUF4272/PF14094_6/0_036Thia_YuaJ/PF09515_10/0_062_
MNQLRYVLYAIDSFYTLIRLHAPWLWSIIDVITLLSIDAVRLFAAHGTAKGIENCHRPKEPLKLYEYEACPFCRKVRETLTVLNIDHVVYPCPRETFSSYGVCLNSRYRPEVKKEGGVAMFPFLVDPNTNMKMHQSSDIISYLWRTYGDKATPNWNYKLAYNKYYLEVSLALCVLLRPCLDMGIMRAPTRHPERPLELWGFESSCFVRRVRETLSMLELAYLYHVMPAGAEAKRKAFAKEHDEYLSSWRKRANLIQVPFLRDPNTGKELFESQDIVKYLKEKYQTRGVPAETWLDYASKQ